MSEPDHTDATHVVPIITIGIAVIPGQSGTMGYMIHDDALASVVESGTVSDLLKTISMMMDHPSILKAVQDQDLMDRMGVK